MKKIISILIFFSLFLIAQGQSDTIYTKKQSKIPCKIQEIGELEIKYKQADNPDGPVFVIDKNRVLKYRLSNGYTEIVKRDELSLEDEHGNILANRSAIKLHPFGFAFNHVSLAFESVIKVGMNLDIEAGLINSGLTNNNGVMFSGRINENPFYSGFYVKPGVKFFLGNDFNVKGMKYAHPLKGRYIKLDLACSVVNYRDVKFYYYHNQTEKSVSTDIQAAAYGGFVNYGRQFILANVLTMDYYIGVGFTGQSYSYSNPDYLNTKRQLQNSYWYYYDDEISQIYQYHGFLRNPQTGLSFTAGFRIGYILPSKSEHKK